MKKYFAKSLLLLVFVAMLLYNCPINVHAIETPQVTETLKSLIAQYENKNSWPSSYGSQCYSFAHFVFNQCFGRNAVVGSYYEGTEYKFSALSADILTLGTLTPGYSSSSLENLLEKAAPGDYIQVKRRNSGGPHSMIVVSVDPSTNIITLFDANSSGGNVVKRYSQSFSYFEERNSGVSIYRYSGYNPIFFNNPSGAIDVVEGKANAIYVRGWAFDKDDTTKSIAVHVYIGGVPGSGAPGYAISANKSRPDVNTVYPGVGENHGYDEIIRTDRVGSQDIYIYAINIGSGENVFLGSKTVNITKDVIPPTISNATISEITASSYTVTCDVSDASGIDTVRFPSWHSTKTGGDAIWYTGTVNNGKATCKIPITELGGKSGIYITHIYAYDTCGNSTCKEVSATVDTTPVSKRKLVNLGTNFYGYISADNGKVLSVEANDNVVNRTNVDADSQRWIFIQNSDGSYTIQSKKNGKCLDNTGAAGTSNSNVAVYTQNNSNAQKWNIIQNEYGSYYLMPKCSTTCVLDLLDYNNNEGANIAIHTFNSSKAQRFTVVDEKPLSERKIEDIGTNFYASIANAGTGKVLSIQNDNVVMKTDTASTSQRWKFTKLSDGSYSIQAKSNQTYLNNSAGTNNSNVNISTVGYNNAQAWQIYNAGGGSYYLKPKSSASCVLDLTNYDNSEGANVAIHNFNSSIAQRYVIHKDAIGVTGITLDVKTMEFTSKNETQSLKATILPVDATNKNIVWSSSNTDVAVVNGNGQVTSVGNGTAIITALTEDGAKMAQCQVTVKIPIKIEKVSLKKEELILTEKNEQYELEVFITPLNATNQKIIWESSDPSVATVDDFGNVTAIKNGMTTISATTAENLTTECQVTVVIPIPVTDIKISETEITLTELNEIKNLVATIEPENATNQEIIWSSDDEEVVVVDNTGKVTAVGEGVVDVIAKTADGDKKVRCRVNVKLPVRVSGISLDYTNLTFSKIGESQKIIPTINPENATNKKVLWSSNDIKVASVNEEGEVTALGEGTTVVSALTEDGNKSVFCIISVKTTGETIHTHNYQQVSKIEPTCTESGKVTYVCSECNSTYSETLQPQGHSQKLVLKNEREATCEESGYTGDYHCEKCGEMIQAGIKIPALGHDWDISIVTKEATCYETGLKTLYCERCFAQKKEIIELKNHTVVTDKALEPTCETEGKTEGSHCSVCGSIFKSQLTLPSLGHDWGEGIIIKEPTSLDKGQILYICKRCNMSKIEETTNSHNITQDVGIITKPSGEKEETMIHEGQLLNIPSLHAVYKIKSIGKEGGSVEYVNPKGNYTTVNIPKTIFIHDRKFKVTSIGKNAFRNNTKIRKIVIPSNVSKIEKNAFLKCKNLKMIVIKTSKLQNKTVGKNAFKGINQKAKIKVPGKRVKYYQKLLEKKGIGDKVIIDKR